MKLGQKTLSLALMVFAALACTILTGLVSTNADGDPADVCDFSGRVAPADFVEKWDTKVYRHGLWTIQTIRHSQEHWASFPGDGPGDTTNIYYGTMHVKKLKGHPSTLEGASAFKTLGKKGEGTQVSLYDLAGDHVPILCILEIGKGNPGFQHQRLFRLEASSDPKTPSKTALREVLEHNEPYDLLAFRDLDKDRVQEAIATASVFNGPYRGGLTYKLVKKWNATTLKFELADPRLLLAGDGEETSAAALTKLAKKKASQLRKAYEAKLAEKPYDLKTDKIALLRYFLELAFIGESATFAETFETHIPAVVKYEYLDMWSKQKMWNWILDETYEARNALKAQLPSIMKLKTCDEAASVTPWK